MLDWGGSGRPIVFLAGFGGTAHDLDLLARRFISGHRVVAITRRGFGRSSHPAATEANYTPERLGADIIAVIRRMRLVGPVIAGHSIAGQELSEIGTRYPKEIAGLIYLEAANSQAYYGPRSEILYPIAGEVRRDLGRLTSAQPSEARLLAGKLRAELARLQRGLDWYERALEGAADRPAEVQSSPQFSIQSAMVRGARIYTRIDVPILAIAAVPPQCAPDCETPASRRRAAEASAQAAEFEASNPSARVVRIPLANHFIWLSNGAQVEREMNAFMDSLERQRARE
ncbi:MAG TPA: alpha/beta hydrolase [Allosphingosinicella sp.]|nr:alpha/beta hydrolase [Allosphingosinicella sp.]